MSRNRETHLSTRARSASRPFLEFSDTSSGLGRPSLAFPIDMIAAGIGLRVIDQRTKLQRSSLAFRRANIPTHVERDVVIMVKRGGTEAEEVLAVVGDVSRGTGTPDI